MEKIAGMKRLMRLVRAIRKTPLGGRLGGRPELDPALLRATNKFLRSAKRRGINVRDPGAVMLKHPANRAFSDKLRKGLSWEKIPRLERLTKKVRQAHPEFRG